MKRELFIKEIEDYHDILMWELAQEGYYEYFNEPYTDKEWLHHDLLDYEENNFYNWTTKDFIDIIKELEEVTGLKTKLGGIK